MSEASGPRRHYGLDWLRLGAFLLLVAHHTLMVFVPGTWLVKVPSPVEAAAWPMILIQPWRMPLLFMVSGYASHQLLARSGDSLSFLAARSTRLLLPLAFGIVVITPPELWVAMVQFHAYRGGFLHFWAHDWFRFDSTLGLALPNLGHLWFLVYLWTYTMLVGIAVALTGGEAKRRVLACLDRLARGTALAWLPLAFLLPLRLAMLFTVPETAGLFHDWVSDLVFLPAFLLGFAAASRADIVRAVRRNAPAAAALAFLASAILLFIEYRFGEQHGHAVQAADRAAQLVLAWSMIMLCLAGSDRFLDRDHPLRRRLNEAIFPLYIAHQTLIVLVAWWLMPLGLSYGWLGAGIGVATIAGSWLFYEIARRSGPLRPFFGLAPAGPKRAPALRLAPVG